MNKNSLFLYRIQPTRVEMLSQGMTAFEEGVVADHFSYLQELTVKGVVLLAGRTLNIDESAFGIVILRAGDEAEARQVMERDPAVKNRVMRAQLFPYRNALPEDWVEGVQGFD